MLMNIENINIKDLKKLHELFDVKTGCPQYSDYLEN